MTESSIQRTNQLAPRTQRSPRTIKREFPGHHPKSYPGRSWNYLTFGAPYLVHKISNFFERIIQREKSGITVTIDFAPSIDLSQDQIAFKKFKRFYEITERPLKPLQREMLIKIGRDLAKSGQKCDKSISIEKLLRKHANQKATRRDFNETDWQLIDEIDHRIIDEHCGSLADIFNSEWFKEMAHNHELESHFGINYAEALLAEIIAFSVAYVQDLGEKTVKIPVFNPDENCYQSAEYTITSTPLGDNLPCYILESHAPFAQPWVTIRGTQRFTKKLPSGHEMRIGSSESILADALDPECIARNLINKAIVRRPIVKEGNTLLQKNSLEDIFRRLHAEGKKVQISAHSLGGTLANTLGVEFPDTIDKVYAFSAVGVSNYTHERWLKLKEKGATSGQNIPKIINFDHEGDPVPSSGCKQIGDHFSLKAIETPEGGGLYKSHVRKHLWNHCIVQKIDVNKENGKRERKFAETIRRIVGRIFRLMLKFSKKERMPDWWRNRKFYRNQADLIRKIRPQVSHIAG